MLILAALVVIALSVKPNMVLIMTDDLDVLLGSEIALPQTQRLIAERGARASNYFVSTPVCGPSRAAWLSGRHYHNLRPHGAMIGPGLNQSTLFDRDAVFPALRRAGYHRDIWQNPKQPSFVVLRRIQQFGSV
jgi:arylsulfatase A-like enzyme